MTNGPLPSPSHSTKHFETLMHASLASLLLKDHPLKAAPPPKGVVYRIRIPPAQFSGLGLDTIEDASEVENGMRHPAGSTSELV